MKESRSCDPELYSRVKDAVSMSPLEVAEANASYDLLLEARRKAAEK